jgi:hypothetical protein
MAKRAAKQKKTTPKVSGETVKKATGRDWDEWGRALDGENAHTLTHGEIARLLHETFNVGDWWSQMVAVGYEQLRNPCAFVGSTASRVLPRISSARATRRWLR